MERDKAIERLRQHEAELKTLGVQHLYMFGSTVRGEAKPESDVDLFFDHPVGSIGLYELTDVQQAASRILGCKADIMTRRSLHRVSRDRIEVSALLGTPRRSFQRSSKSTPSHSARPVAAGHNMFRQKLQCRLLWRR